MKLPCGLTSSMHYSIEASCCLVGKSAQVESPIQFTLGQLFDRELFSLKTWPLNNSTGHSRRKFASSQLFRRYCGWVSLPLSLDVLFSVPFIALARLSGPPTMLRHDISMRVALAILWWKSATRLYSNSVFLSVKQMPPRPKIDESEVMGSYLKGSGPGGQKIVSFFSL